MDPALQSILPDMIDRINGWRGSLIELVELTIRDGIEDRHFGTRTAFAMWLDHAGVAFSGAKLMLCGRTHDRTADYQASLDLMKNVVLEPETIRFTEEFGVRFKRHTTITLLPSSTVTP